MKIAFYLSFALCFSVTAKANGVTAINFFMSHARNEPSTGLSAWRSHACFSIYQDITTYIMKHNDNIFKI